MEIKTILDQIDLGSYALPEFQRGYVWNRDQVKKLMYSLYRGYPIGGLLTWVTSTNEEITRGDQLLQTGNVNLILDGQQRITSLYGIINGKQPKFFEGNANAFTGLYFNILTEVFEFYAPLKMKDDSNWINVTELMQKGASVFIKQFIGRDNKELELIIGRLTRLEGIKKINLHIQQVAGADKTIDVVVEIFNNVNSGGTKLSKGDLALAKICAEWAQGREEMKIILQRMRDAGYNFEMEWLLRCVTVYLTGKPYFAELSDIPVEKIKTGLTETSKLIDKVLNQIGSRLGLDHDRVLGSRYSIPLMVGYLKNAGAKTLTNTDWNKLLYWYVHTFLWGRYAGSTESVLAQDLNILHNGKGVDGLIAQLRNVRGNLTVSAIDFDGWSTGARFYPLLYMLTRVGHAKDWGSGIELSNALLGKNSSLEVHHIYPKDLLYKHGYKKDKVNSLANYVFLTKDTNLEITNKPPKEYIPFYLSKQPGSVESHWMPLDDIGIFEMERYEEFLQKRRELLAKQTNSYLESLLQSADNITIEDYSNRQTSASLTENDEDILHNIMIWMKENQLDVGISNFELTDENGNQLAIIDLAWPNGIQCGLSEKVALLLNEPPAIHSIINENGFRFFTDEETFKSYIRSNYLAD